MLRGFEDIFDVIVDLEKDKPAEWDALLLDPDYEERKEKVKQVQSKRIIYLDA